MNALSAQTYCIAVRDKAGEVAALSTLTPAISQRVLAHVVARPKAPTVSDAEFVKERVGNVLRAVGKNPVIWDSRFTSFDNNDPDRDAVHLAFLLSQFRSFGAQLIPAVHRHFSYFKKKALTEHARLAGLPICLIVDFSQVGDWDSLLTGLADMGVSPENCVIKIEISDADLSEHHEFAEFLHANIVRLTDLAAWAKIIVCGTSYPFKNLAPADGQHRFQRDEWLVWQELAQLLNPKAMDVMFGDYGADHAKIDYKGGGRTIQHLRWSKDDETVIVRGNSDFASIHGVAKRTIALFEKHDPEFSQGDAFLRRCVSGVPGTATTWRTANMNRHATLLVYQTSKLLGLPLTDFKIKQELQLEFFPLFN